MQPAGVAGSVERDLESPELDPDVVWVPIADPDFKNATAADFRLPPESPALKTGFKPFDYSRAGVRGPAAWIQKARDLKFRLLKLAPSGS